jgi:hypothetical protein
MQTPDVSGFAAAALEWLVNKGALPTLGVAAVLVWTLVRTGSTHLITMRLWQLVIGKRKEAANRLGDYLDDRDALMRFRLQTGMRTVGTIKQVEKLIEWLHEKDVDIDKVRACGPSFDAQQPGLKAKLPTGTKRFFATIASAFFLYVAIIQGTTIVIAPAFIQIVNSTRWYGVSDERTFHLQWGAKAPGFAASECTDRNALVTKTKYPEDDVNALCDLLAGDKHQAYLQNARLTQSIPLVVGCAAALFFMIILFGYVKQAGAAISLRKELERKPSA